MTRKPWTLASRVRVGDAVRLPDDERFRTVVRITGSPGRRSPGKAPLLRFFVGDDDTYVTVRSDAPLQVDRSPERGGAMPTGSP